jgi:hypothetical protein
VTISPVIAIVSVIACLHQLPHWSSLLEEARIESASWESVLSSSSVWTRCQFRPLLDRLPQSEEPS